MLPLYEMQWTRRIKIILGSFRMNAQKNVYIPLFSTYR